MIMNILVKQNIIDLNDGLRKKDFASLWGEFQKFDLNIIVGKEVVDIFL